MLDGKTVTCLGGTFNRVHAGHRLLVKAAFESAEKVAVGVASDSLVRRLRKARAADVRPYAQREADVRRLLQGYGADRYTLVSLDDPYSPAKREEFDAIVVSPDTRKTAEEINALRALRGFADLRIIEVPHVLAFDGQPLSSTRVLSGEIDEEGRPAGVKAEAHSRAALPEPVPEVAPPPAPPAPLMAQAAPEELPAPTKEPAGAESAGAVWSSPAPPRPKPRPRRKAKTARAGARKPLKAPPRKRKPTGKKAAAKRAKGRSKARKGSRASGPRSRR